MLSSKKMKNAVYGLLGLIMVFGLMIGLGNKVYAAGKTEYVSSAEEFEAALKDGDVDHIYITHSFDVPCKTATTSSTSYFTVDRSMIIEGSRSDITIKRTIADGANNGRLQSIIAIKGNGNPDTEKETSDGKPKGIEVSIFRLTLDGGADFGTIEGYDRVTSSSQIINENSACGRSIVDVYNKATLNLEDGLTIMNGYCSYSLASTNGDSGSRNYGGGVRVDWDEYDGGGTVNVKAGSCIKNCATDGGSNSYGGGIGAYSYSHLNVYGGIIENCSSYHGGGVGCTWRAGHGGDSAGTFNMYGGTIRNCSANKGGGISADGSVKCQNYLLGGTIEGCSAITGGAVALGGSGDGDTTLHIAPYEDGTLVITDCTDQSSTSSDAIIDGKPLGYKGVYLSGGNSTVHDETFTVIFKKTVDDEENYAELTVNKGASLGESFPGDPQWSYHSFIGWNTKADGTEDPVDKNTKITGNMTVYARWLLAPEVETETNINETYGVSEIQLEVKATATYGGALHYKWYQCDSDKQNKKEIGNDNNKIIITNLAAGNYYFYCDVENRSSVSSGGGKTVTAWGDLITVSIAPKTLKVDWSDTEFDYDGTAKKPTAEIKEGIIEGDDVQVVVSGEQTEPGEYTATAALSGNESANYVIADDDKKAGFTIIAPPTPTPTPTLEPTPESTSTPEATPELTPTAGPTDTPALPGETPEVTPSAEPTSTPAADADITKEIPYAENVPVEEKEEVIKNENTDKNDVEGSTHKYLMLKITPKKTSIKLTWKKIKGADGYKIYGAKCGKKMVTVATITNPSKKSYTIKKLKKGTYYKYLVVAYKTTSEGDKVITTAKSVHAATTGGVKGNPTALKLKKSKFTLKVGKTAKIKASYKKKKKVSVHIAKFRYESTDEQVATVDAKGRISAQGKGKCKIYVYTQNGICKTVNVTVK